MKKASSQPIRKENIDLELIQKSPNRGDLGGLHLLMKVLRWIWTYLKDWKNILSHSIIGISILLIAFYLPVKPIYRIIILILVVAFNITRMKVSKNRAINNRNKRCDL